jgi:ribosomal protein S18 acetylase RimI-like enzyme
MLGDRTEGMLENLQRTGVDEILPGEDQKMFEAVETDGKPCGTVVMSERETIAYVWGLYVLPTHQRRGIGKELMRRICRETKPETEIEIQVLRDSKKAISFYDALGFRAFKSGNEEVFQSISLDVKFMTCRAGVVLAHLPPIPPLSFRSL